MNPDTEQLATHALEAAATAGLLASAASIASGLALVSTPVKVLGLLTIGSATAVSWPLVAAVGSAGAIVGGLAAARAEGRRQERIRSEFSELMSQPDPPQPDPPQDGRAKGPRKKPPLRTGAD